MHSRRCLTAIIILPSFHESLKHIYYVDKLIFWMWLIVWLQSESILDFEGWAIQKHSYDAKMPCFMNLWCILVRELTTIWDATAVIVQTAENTRTPLNVVEKKNIGTVAGAVSSHSITQCCGGSNPKEMNPMWPRITSNNPDECVLH